MPLLPQANIVPGCQLRTKYLMTNYQRARSCRHAKENHSVSSPSAESGPHKQLALLQLLDAMWNLSLQLEGLTYEQTTMKKRNG